MTTYPSQTSFRRHRPNQHKNGKVLLGAVIILLGLFMLIKRMKLLPLSFHLWPLILIALGIHIGMRHRFNHFGSWVLITLGVLFMIPKFTLFGVLSTHLVIPVVLILLGVYLIVKPPRNNAPRDPIVASVDNDFLEIDLSFGERNAMVTSKNFKGGTIRNTFGEVRLSLTQADSTEPIILDLKVSFGSVDILVPSHWEVDMEVDNSFASIEDKRYMRTMQPENPRTLILTGSCSFGSVTVRSLS